MKKKLTMLLLYMLTLFLFCIPAAADAKLSPQTIWTDGGVGAGGGHVCFSDWLNNATIVSAKSSKPKILKVKYKKGGDANWQIELIGKKPGKSKVTVTYRIGSRTYTTSAVYTVKKYPRFLKYLTVNGQKADFKKSPSILWVEAKKIKSVKIKYKTANGWKLSKNPSRNPEGVYYVGNKEVYFTPKNGQAFAFRKPKMFVNYKFQKGKDTIFYQVAVMMPGA